MPKKFYVVVIFVIGIIAALLSLNGHPFHVLDRVTGSPSVSASPSPTAGGFVFPIQDALTRVTKKPFGIYITPATSPVQPEKFTGYHTGVDFETFSQEESIDVVVATICDGPLLQKRTATGYGGVVVQSCQIDGQPVTVIYGHIKLASVIAAVGQKLKAGERLAILGKGYSSETDGERKHLHLGIHKGNAINILGYAQKEADLAQWINPLPLLH